MGQNDVGGASWPGAESLFLALVGGVPLGEEASRPVGGDGSQVRASRATGVAGPCPWVLRGLWALSSGARAPGQSCAPEADVGFRQLALESGLTPVGLA